MKFFLQFSQHNFTDGMALGSAFLLHGSVGGWSTTLFLLAHELPQEVCDTTLDCIFKNEEQNHLMGECTSRGIPIPLQNPKGHSNDLLQDELHFCPWHYL